LPPFLWVLPSFFLPATLFWEWDGISSGWAKVLKTPLTAKNGELALISKTQKRETRWSLPFFMSV
jgi:hypothetical protein